MKRQQKIGYFQKVKRPEKDYESSLSSESDSESDPLDDDSDEGEPSSCSALQGVTRKPESRACINECCQNQVEAWTPYQPSDIATLSHDRNQDKSSGL